MLKGKRPILLSKYLLLLLLNSSMFYLFIKQKKGLGRKPLNYTKCANQNKSIPNMKHISKWYITHELSLGSYYSARVKPSTVT